MIYCHSILLLLFFFSTFLYSSDKKTLQQDFSSSNLSQAILAGGCFWCTESDLEKLLGVSHAISGYTGGIIEKPNYEQVSQGKTKHLEAVKVFYDSTKVSYSQILQYFFKTIDPTDSGGQFSDRGHLYTSAIFYLNSNQQKIAIEEKNKLEKTQKFNLPIYTIIRPAQIFYPAENYHQNYYKKKPNHYQSYRYYSGRTPFIEKHWGDIYTKKKQ